MVSTRLRCRLFRPWIVKPCSRVLRKLSGELTTIQYWALRAAPDLRLRRDRPDLGARSCSGGESSSDMSATVVAGWKRTQVARLWDQGAQVADLRDVAHLVAGDEAAH